MSTNAMIPTNFGAVSTKFAPTTESSFAAGVQAGYGLIGYRGKVWSTRYRGEERQLMREDGDGPRGSIEIVVIKASNHISKIWYEAGFIEGSSSAPDCFSSNGQTPDLASRKKQSDTCAGCAKNAWGSRITPEGKAGKACSDSKRLAVVPLNDIKNEMFGGPMLLRVPAASLQDLASFGNKLHQMGYPESAIGVRVSFEPTAAFPKFVFSAIRPLTDAEADIVLELQKAPEVARILAEASEIAAPVQDPAAAPIAFEQPPAAKVAAAAAPTKQGDKPVTAPKAATQLSDEKKASLDDRINAMFPV